MTIDKFQAAENALQNFEKLFGEEVLEVFSVANGYISRELTDGMVAGVPQRTALDKRNIWVVPIKLAKKLGVYGEVGALVIEEKTHTILGTTTKSEIFQKAEVLLNEETKVI